MLKWKLRACRVQAGYTQKEAAKLIGVSEDVIINYETGRTVVDMETAQKISELYQIPLELIDFTKVGNKPTKVR